MSSCSSCSSSSAQQFLAQSIKEITQPSQKDVTKKYDIAELIKQSTQPATQQELNTSGPRGTKLNVTA